jgi:murein DD-endopeptidase MepM/ murein hydrolase activator NlpD
LASLETMLSNRLAAVALALTAAALFALLLAAPAALGEDLQSQLEAKQSKLSEVQEHKGVLTTTIAHNKAQIDGLLGEVEGIRAEEKAVLARLSGKQQELDAAIADLELAKGRLNRARSHLRRALQALSNRLVAIYETGTPDLVSLIVNSTDFDDLAARAEYLDRLHSMDEAVAERVRTLRDQVRGIVVRRRTAKDRIEAARDAIAAEERSLASPRRTLQGRRQALVAARGRRLAVLERIDEHEEELDGALTEIQAKIAAQLGSTGSFPLSAGPIAGATGTMIWPVSGPVVSGFGPRTIGGSYEYHPGIDIAVGEGTAIQAADGGIVLFTQSESSSGGYGNYTCLDHGSGLSTCYAHQSRFAVVPGQSVSQGQVIGYTGCTGYCLGPHLHFEVRVGGAVTDPMGYL